jgi:hypothetical protein
MVLEERCEGVVGHRGILQVGRSGRSTDSRASGRPRRRVLRGPDTRSGGCRQVVHKCLQNLYDSRAINVARQTS